MTTYLFFFLSFLAALCGIMVVASKNPIHSILYLIITFFSIAGHYVLLNAQFLAAVHVIVYAGAIMVLFLFVVMLLNLNKESQEHKSNVLKLTGTVAAGMLLLIMVGSLKGVNNIRPLHQFKGDIGLIENLGKTLFNDFLLPFEVASVLLLAAMVGAILIGKKDIN